jgi:hypothetical protein
MFLRLLQIIIVLQIMSVSLVQTQNIRWVRS